MSVKFTRRAFAIHLAGFGLALGLLLIVGGISTFAFSQPSEPTLIPFQSGDKWGFINPIGKVVITPRFDKADRFFEGLARVEVGLDVGFIDATGKFVIEPKFRCAFGFSEGLAAVAEKCDGSWGYIDRNGRYVIEAKFKWAGTFSEGRAEVLVDPDPKEPGDLKTGYINQVGELVIPAKYGWAESFSNGLALIADDKPNSRERFSSEYFNQRAFIDKNGVLATPFFESAESFSEGLAPVEINSLWGFIDSKGQIVINPEYDFVLRGFENGFAAVNCLNDKIAFIDKSGKKLTKCVFTEAFPFSEGLAAVGIPGRGFGFINMNGRLVIPPKFAYADSFFNGLARVRMLRQKVIYEGFIDYTGRYVVPLRKLPADD